MENRRRQRKQRNIPSVSGLLFTREWRIQLYLDKTFIIIILINSVIQSVGGDDGDLVSRLQTVMILLEHFENQYCSTPDTTSGSWSSLPPSLPPPKQTLGGLSPCWDWRTRWGSEWGWGWLRLTEMQVREWEAVRQQTVCGCQCCCPWHRSQ